MNYKILSLSLYNDPFRNGYYSKLGLIPSHNQPNKKIQSNLFEDKPTQLPKILDTQRKPIPPYQFSTPEFIDDLVKYEKVEPDQYGAIYALKRLQTNKGQVEPLYDFFSWETLQSIANQQNSKKGGPLTHPVTKQTSNIYRIQAINDTWVLFPYQGISSGKVDIFNKIKAGQRLFIGLNFMGEDFIGDHFPGNRTIQFLYCNFEGAHFQNAHFNETITFSHSNLSGASFRGCTFSNMLSQIVFEECQINHTILPPKKLIKHSSLFGLHP